MKYNEWKKIADDYLWMYAKSDIVNEIDIMYRVMEYIMIGYIQCRNGRDMTLVDMILIYYIVTRKLIDFGDFFYTIFPSPCKQILYASICGTYYALAGFVGVDKSGEEWDDIKEYRDKKHFIVLEHAKAKY